MAADVYEYSVLKGSESLVNSVIPCIAFFFTFRRFSPLSGGEHPGCYLGSARGSLVPSESPGVDMRRSYVPRFLNASPGSEMRLLRGLEAYGVVC